MWTDEACQLLARQANLIILLMHMSLGACTCSAAGPSPNFMNSHSYASLLMALVSNSLIRMGGLLHDWLLLHSFYYSTLTCTQILPTCWGLMNAMMLVRKDREAELTCCRRRTEARYHRFQLQSYEKEMPHLRALTFLSFPSTEAIITVL